MNQTTPSVATRLANRAVVRIAGEGVRDFLQGLVTNDMNALAAGRPLWAALLSAQGKVLFDFILWADGADVLIDCEADRAQDLVRRLTLYRLRRPITLAVDDALGVHWAAQETDAGDNAADDPRLATLGRRWIGAPQGDAADGAYHARRMALGVPEGAAELGVDKTLWLEADAVELNGVSFTKGCYVGQENTARMHHRDKLRRRLLPVTLDGDPGDAGELRTADGKAAGELRAHIGGRGMAWLRMELADGPLSAGDTQARVAWPAWLERGSESTDAG